MGIEGNSRIAVVLIAIIVISSIGFVLLLNTGPQTLEWRYGDDDTRRGYDVIKVTYIEDTNISVTFVDDPGLIARVTYELHSDNTAPLYIDDDTIGVVEISGGSGNDRVKTLDVVLGIESAYNILIRGVNLTASITYSNNANINNADVRFESPSSSIEFTLTEDIQIPNAIFDVDIYASYADVHIDLPVGLNGIFSYSSSSTINLLNSNGWSSYTGGYRTPSYDEYPQLTFAIDADTVQAWLST